jgi:SNF2 family DNA or RNA helicase
MSRLFTPRPHQAIAIDFLLSTPRCNLWAGMGLGKTVCAVTVVDLLRLTGTDDPILVLGPLRVARDTWPGEIDKWEHLRHLHLAPIIGDRHVRANVLRQKADLYSINYDNLPWLIEALGDKPWPFRVVIADESTRLKGYRTQQGGVRTRALAKVARDTDRWINLTGTPASNGLKDLWGQMWFIDFGARLGRTHTDFMQRWFSKNEYTRRIEPHRHSEAEIHARIADVTLSINPKDWFDLEEPIPNEVRVTLPPAARIQYKQLEKDMFTTLSCGTELEVFNAAALTNKCRQFANGAAYTENPKWVAVHDAKLDALESVIEEAGGDQLLVSYAFVSDRERILHRFKQAADISTPAGFKAFMQGDKQLGVAHPKSMGHGIDGMQDVCNHLVYFGLDWDLELHQQILERIGPVRQMQSGLDRPVWVTSIIADGTLDDTLIERHHDKRAVQDLLLEAMSRRTA